MKVVFLGETTVGKTCILSVANGGEFPSEQTATVGACFIGKTVYTSTEKIKLNLWDTAGQERFKSLTPMFYRDADVIVLVYSISCESSFIAIDSWFKCIQNDCIKSPTLFLVGNKADLESERMVTKEQGMDLAKRINAEFFEFSAKFEKEKVDSLIDHICEIHLNTDNKSDEAKVKHHEDKNIGNKCC